ncbi:hypothetical protein [Rhodococcus artemisiae]|uniref:Uncharacterized protein n=1 Tax=Rhodococcus artemisiae TaxID=714159 RepID=A0ABU7LBM6_9NOCA|nr:hypothetical protein [Rhodococcus artemisiae]MEE2058950.1 hypothetical protein [Rhodococcus artemisiae]
MARIRTLKPEFWDSPSTAQADLAVRLTFMAMWNWADDSGHGTANMKELEAFVFPNDDVAELPRKSRGNSADAAGTWRSFAEVCGEVSEAYGVVFYRVSGRPYYEIPNFKRHQSKDFRPTSKYPLPAEGEIYDVTSGNSFNTPPMKTSAGDALAETRGISADSRGNSAGAAGTSGSVIGEQGNRGTGEEEICSPAPPSSDTESEQPDPTDYPDTFEEFWHEYPRKAGKRKALTAWKRAVRRVSNETLIDGAIRYAQDPNRVDRFTKYAEGWLNGDGWLDEPLPGRNSEPNGMTKQDAKVHGFLGTAQRINANRNTNELRELM